MSGPTITCLTLRRPQQVIAVLSVTRSDTHTCWSVELNACMSRGAGQRLLTGHCNVDGSADTWHAGFVTWSGAPLNPTAKERTHTHPTVLNSAPAVEQCRVLPVPTLGSPAEMILEVARLTQQSLQVLADTTPPGLHLPLSPTFRIRSAGLTDLGTPGLLGWNQTNRTVLTAQNSYPTFTGALSAALSALTIPDRLPQVFTTDLQRWSGS